jgi:hypothetical protein
VLARKDWLKLLFEDNSAVPDLSINDDFVAPAIVGGVLPIFLMVDDESLISLERSSGDDYVSAVGKIAHDAFAASLFNEEAAVLPEFLNGRHLASH